MKLNNRLCFIAAHEIVEELIRQQEGISSIVDGIAPVKAWVSAGQQRDILIKAAAAILGEIERVDYGYEQELLKIVVEHK